MAGDTPPSVSLGRADFNTLFESLNLLPSKEEERKIRVGRRMIGLFIVGSYISIYSRSQYQASP